MKKSVIILLVSAICAVAFAQEGPSKAMRDRIQAEKIAYITHELELTPDEAQVFWPVYNQFEKEQRESNKLVRDSQKALQQAIESGKSDSDTKPLLDAWVAAKKAQKNFMVEHRAEFVKIIGEAKTAKLFMAEENFRNQQIRKIAGQNSEFDELFRKQKEEAGEMHRRLNQRNDH